MQLKPGVSLLGLRPELTVAIMAAQEVCRELGVGLVLTSVGDGTHSRGSRHYSGLAFDMRRREMADAEAARARDMLADRLGADFDVILEATHIHVEFDPGPAG